jgi:lipopolysaccharide export system protein LptC
MRGLLPLGLLLTLALATTWYLHRVESQLANTRPEEHPSVYAEAWDVDLLMTDVLGLPRYRLLSPHAVEATGRGGTDLETPRLTVFEAGRAPAESRAKHGWLSPDQTLLQLEGEVDLRRAGADGSPGTRLQTPSLLIFPEENRAQTDAPVVISSPGHRITGVGLRADLEREHYELLSEVRGQHEMATR